jgi:2-dehydro-3-deoxygluconokinase
LGRAAGLTISLDVNLRRRLWSDLEAGPVLRELAAGADVVLGSPDELAVVGDRAPGAGSLEVAGAVLALGPTVAVLKLGAAGALLVTGDAASPPISRPALPLPTVIDPIGAGDAFCAGFIAARLEGSPFERALDQANACGAACAAALSDQAGMPDRDELAALLTMGTGTPDTVR